MSATITGIPAREFRLDTWMRPKTFTEDTDGVPITNSAGDPLPITIEVEAMELVVVQSRDAFDPALADRFLDTLNDRALYVGEMRCEARTLKVIDLSGPLVLERGDVPAHHRVLLIIRHNPDGWSDPALKLAPFGELGVDFAALGRIESV